MIFFTFPGFAVPEKDSNSDEDENGNDYAGGDGGGLAVVAAVVSGCSAWGS